MNRSFYVDKENKTIQVKLVDDDLTVCIFYIMYVHTPIMLFAELYAWEYIIGGDKQTHRVFALLSALLSPTLDEIIKAFKFYSFYNSPSPLVGEDQ